MTGLRCSKCSGPMAPGPSSDELLFGCEACGAVWMDNAACQLLLDLELSEASMDFIKQCDAVSDLERESTSPYREVGAARGACPVCNSVLLRTTLENGITIELCRSHGTLFERSEARRILFDRAAYSAAAAASKVRIRIRDRVNAEFEAARLRERRERRRERLVRKDRKRRRDARRARRAKL